MPPDDTHLTTTPPAPGPSPGIPTRRRARAGRFTAVDLVVDELAALAGECSTLPAAVGGASHQLVASHEQRDSIAFRIGAHVVYATPDEAEVFALRLLASARAAMRAPAGTWHARRS